MATKRTFKLAEVCRQLDLPPYVLRYWETEFPALKSDGRGSGAARSFSAADVALLRRIKQLLYEEGYTIAGAKKKLESEPSAARSETPALFEESAGNPIEAGGAPIDDPVAGDPAEELPELDSSGDERIERLRKGIAEALDETRAILALLEKSSR
jgi:DNA-binding transcriptional MerR regulator